MTEDQIERLVECRTTSFDKLYMSGRIKIEEYDRKLAYLHRWAVAAYNKRKSDHELKLMLYDYANDA